MGFGLQIKTAIETVPSDLIRGQGRVFLGLQGATRERKGTCWLILYSVELVAPGVGFKRTSAFGGRVRGLCGAELSPLLAEGIHLQGIIPCDPRR